MSALGHKQTFAPHKVMSALPPKADIYTRIIDVCFVPIADTSPISRLNCQDKKKARFAAVFSKSDQIALFFSVATGIKLLDVGP